MSQRNNHIIAKQTIELVLPRKENGFEWNQQISEFCNKKLNKALDKLFDNYSDSETTIRLDKLEIDLGRLNQTKLDDELVSKIVTRIDEQLYKLIKLGNTTVDGKFVPVSRENIHESVFNDWLQYLQFGFIPIQAARINIEELENEILSFVAGEIKAKEKIKDTLKQSEITVTRLILQHSDIFLQKLLTSYTGIKQDMLLALLGELILFEKNLIQRLEKLSEAPKMLLKMFPKSVFVSQRISFWKEIINHYIFSGTTQTSYSRQQLHQLIVDQVILVVKRVANKNEVFYNQKYKLIPWQQELTENKTSYPVLNQLSETYKKVLLQSLKKEISYLFVSSEQLDKNSLDDEKKKGNLIKQHEDSELTNKKQITKDSDIHQDKEELTDNKTDNKREKVLDKSSDDEEKSVEQASVISIESEKSNITDESKQFKTERTEKDMLQFGDKEQSDFSVSERKKIEKRQNSQKTIKKGESFYIQNAGVVLLNPFIVTFFKKLELVENDDFADIFDREKAVHIIHYLATGQTGLPEYELLLPKLLCGLSFKEPIDRFIELNKSEQSEAVNLLQTAIEHWGALGNASINALREGFLQRDGKLEKINNGWRLYVEQKAIDALLRRLPMGWMLGTVKFPWMEEILHVEWG